MVPVFTAVLHGEKSAGGWWAGRSLSSVCVVAGVCAIYLNWCGTKEVEKKLLFNPKKKKCSDLLCVFNCRHMWNCENPECRNKMCFFFTSCVSLPVKSTTLDSNFCPASCAWAFTHFTPFTPTPTIPSSILDVCEWDGSSEVVLLDTAVAPLCSCGVTGIASWSWDVHADHVPEVTLQRTPMVVWRPRRGWVGHGFCFHHGHGHRAGLLGTAAVWHGAMVEKTYRLDASSESFKYKYIWLLREIRPYMHLLIHIYM